MPHDRLPESATEKKTTQPSSMPDDTPTIRHATGQDATVLAELGARIFYGAFAKDN